MIRRVLGNLLGVLLILWIAACADCPLPVDAAPVCPAPVDAAPCVDAGPCVVGDVPGMFSIHPLNAGKRPCWRTAAGIVCPSEPPEPMVTTTPVGYFADLGGWQMIDAHAAAWNAIAENVQRCSR